VITSARFVCASCHDVITPEQALNTRLTLPELCRACARTTQRYIMRMERSLHLGRGHLAWDTRLARVEAVLARRGLRSEANREQLNALRSFVHKP